MSDIPDGVSDSVAQIVVAWEIVKKSCDRINWSAVPSRKIAQAYTDLFVDVQKAIFHGEHLEEKPS